MVPFRAWMILLGSILPVPRRQAARPRGPGEDEEPLAPPPPPVPQPQARVAHPPSPVPLRSHSPVCDSWVSRSAHCFTAAAPPSGLAPRALRGGRHLAVRTENREGWRCRGVSEAFPGHAVAPCGRPCRGTERRLWRSPRASPPRGEWPAVAPSSRCVSGSWLRCCSLRTQGRPLRAPSLATLTGDSADGKPPLSRPWRGSRALRHGSAARSRPCSRGSEGTAGGPALLPAYSSRCCGCVEPPSIAAWWPFVVPDSEWQHELRHSSATDVWLPKPQDASRPYLPSRFASTYFHCT